MKPKASSARQHKEMMRQIVGTPATLFFPADICAQLESIPLEHGYTPKEQKRDAPADWSFRSLEDEFDPADWWTIGK